MTWSGGPVGARATCILAPNPGPMTLDGTNTWILREPSSSRAVLVDPGPDLPEHRDAISRFLTSHDLTLAHIVLTHGHTDHSEGARSLHELTGAPVAALDPAHRCGSEGVQDGDVFDVDGLVLRVITTPGHTRDSISLLLEAENALLTGDTVLGRGTTIIAHPDGRVADYLDSLERMQHEVDVAQRVRTILPGHGPVVDSPSDVLAFHVRHRRERLDQVAGVREQLLRDDPALDDAALTEQIVDVVYRDTPAVLRGAAVVSTLAQLAYLEQINNG